MSADSASPIGRDLHINPERLHRLITELSRFGKDPKGGVSRIAFSENDKAAMDWLAEKMTDAGLEVWVDPAASIHGRRRGRDSGAPAVLFGSHIDTVPQGGDFDGALGSLGALEIMMTLKDKEAETARPLEMVVWSDEEGAHYGKGFFGSRAATMGLDPGELEMVDEEGVVLADWLRRYGLDPIRLDEARLDAQDYSSYLELHIEQGPVLYGQGKQIGVVEGIVGIDRFDVTIEGFANHAGTTPMEERRDAMIAASRLTLAVREEITAKPGRQVGNVGWVKVVPGATNVVPGLVRMPIELRDVKKEVIGAVAERIQARARGIAGEEDVSLNIELSGRESPCLTDAPLRGLIEDVAAEGGFSTLRMPSGAGHDAQVISKLGIPAGMIFVPSRGGVSHSPEEWTDWEDCARGVEVLYGAVRNLADVDKVVG